jgi:nicotinate-nucleotide adenylyltransferase
MIMKEFLKLNSFLDALPINRDAEVIFFGGSFNPWHAGHAECLRLAPANLTKIVLPDQSPLKENHKHQQDLDLIKAEISKIPNTYFFDTFSFLTIKNPTFEWLNYLAQNSSYKLSLLIGMDNFLHFNKWYRYRDIINITHHIYIASRLESGEQKDQALQDLKPHLIENKFQFLGRHPFEALSSTNLRKNSPT